MRLRDRVAVVTGASRGIGRAIAIEFAREGADVVINYLRSREKAEEVVEEIRSMGRNALALRADVSSYEEVERMAETVMEEFGRVDVLVNNAGVINEGGLEELSPEEWERTVAINLNGVYYPMRAFGRRMLEAGRGVIINISSVAGELPLVGAGAYSPTKAAVTMLTRQAAAEWGPRGVRVNAICPGPILTDMLMSEYTPEQLEARKRVTPLRRMGEPWEVARLAVFLASDEASYVTGACYLIDGGVSVSAYPMMRELIRIYLEKGD